MRRRDFVRLLGGTAAAWPVTALTQQALPVVGFLNSGAAAAHVDNVSAFRQGLSQTGFVEGRNVAVEYRWAGDQYERLSAMAADFVSKKVAVIAATTTPVPPVAKAATTTIPIVFVTGADPIKAGLVASLNRPTSNITGVTALAEEVGPKRLELLHDVVPTISTFVLLINPADRSAESQTRALEAAAKTLGLKIHTLHASTTKDFDNVFTAMTRLRAGALLISADPFFTSHSKELAELTVRHGVPAMFRFREFTVAGGLMSYGSSLTDAYRLAGVYTGRILKGEKPADLPVQQSTKVELFINLKSAKSLGVIVPPALLARADEVIE
jgi:putative ABC transport system substrate-binding protein